MMLTLCANELQARLLRDDHNQAHWRAGEAAWEAANIWSFERWTRQHWLNQWPPEELISRTKERWLWLELIAAEPLANTVLAPEQLAQQVMRTWRLCQQWSINPEHAPRWTPEQELYARLHQAMHTQLQDRGWITDSQLAGAILPTLQPQSAIQLAPGVWSNNLPPMQRKVLQRLGLQLQRQDQAQAGPRQGWLCTDSEQQWQALAQRLRPLITQPDARVVVGVHNLAQHRNQLEDAWREELCAWADTLPAAREDHEPPWQVELPRALPEWPMAKALLDVLQLLHAPLSFSDLSAVLRQPLFYDAQEWLYCVQAEAGLRQRGLRFSVNDLEQSLADDAPPALKQRFAALAQCIHERPRRARAAQWINHFQHLWTVFPLHPNAAVWRLREDLSRSLAGFQSLDDELGLLSPRQATRWLFQVLDDHYHSPPALKHSPVLVCELDLACTLPASHTFLCGLDGAAWPPPAPSQPWLNPELLASVKHPAQSSASWYADQQAYWQSALNQPAQLELYACAQDSSGQTVQPSPWLAASWQQTPTTDSEHRVGTQDILEAPLATLGPQRLQGQRRAVNMLRHMARTPFAAFILDRLRTNQLPEIAQGLAPDRQGSWVHAMLDQAWAHLRSSRKLAATSDEALLGLLQDISSDTGHEYLPSSRFGPFLRRLETDRIVQLCLRWLQHERRRRDPFEVIYRELDIEETRAQLPMRMRIDRIDRVLLPDRPRLLIVDYKTGQADFSGWSSEGLHEPQLPLYATSQALAAHGLHPVDGICFARVHHRQMALVAATNWCQKLIEDRQEKAWRGAWEEELQAWERRLRALIADYAQGEARHATQYALQQDWSLRALGFLLDADGAQEDAHGPG
nr:PD-(D/E)XK nuclease family protein [Oceanococcus sp. HetDA_MAG_MS8]